MVHAYSTYQAKARFSEVIRRVRAGHRVVITFHGEEVAEIRPIARTRATLEQRVRKLEERGVLSPPAARRRPWTALANRRGALAHFLADRD